MQSATKDTRHAWHVKYTQQVQQIRIEYVTLLFDFNFFFPLSQFITFQF